MINGSDPFKDRISKELSHYCFLFLRALRVIPFDGFLLL